MSENEWLCVWTTIATRQVDDFTRLLYCNFATKLSEVVWTPIGQTQVRFESQIRCSQTLLFYCWVKNNIRDRCRVLSFYHFYEANFYKFIKALFKNWLNKMSRGEITKSLSYDYSKMAFECKPIFLTFILNRSFLNCSIYLITLWLNL